MFKKMPVLLLALIVAIFAFSSVIPLEIKQFVYSISTTIKSLIIFVLPIVIFGLLFKATVELSQKASKVIGLILAGVLCSSFIALILSHYLGSLIYNFDFSIALPRNSDELQPLWELALPKLLSNGLAML